MNCGPIRPLGRLHRRERHHRARVVAHVELPDLLRRHAVLALRLQEDAPLPAEAVELVHVQAAEKRLHRLVDVAERDALPQHLVAIDVGEDLRHVGGERRRHAGELGPLARCGQELLQLLVEELDRAAAAILQPQREAALTCRGRESTAA